MVLRLKNKEEYDRGTSMIRQVSLLQWGKKNRSAHRFFREKKERNRRNLTGKKIVLLVADKQEMACMFNGFDYSMGGTDADK